jgi:hypothetical protein
MLRMIELKAEDGSTLILIIGPADNKPLPSVPRLQIFSTHKTKKKKSQGCHASSKQSRQTAAQSRS